MTSDKPFDRTTNGWTRKDGKVVPSHQWKAEDYQSHILALEIDLGLMKKKLSAMETALTALKFQTGQHHSALCRSVGAIEDALSTPPHGVFTDNTANTKQTK